MALTNLTAISRIMSRLNEGDTPVIFSGDMLPLIADALKNTAEVVSESKNTDVRQLLRKDFSITVTSGTGSLTTPLTAAEPLLESGLKHAHLVTSTGAVMQRLPDRAQLSLSRPLGFYIYFCNDDGTLRTRNTDGSLTSLSTTVTCTANFVPIITSISGQELETIFLDVLERSVKGRMAVVQEAANA